MSQTLQQALHDRIVIFDGAMGTEIYRRNFFVNISFENLRSEERRVGKECL